jgi:hypothetical protein
MKVAHEVLEIPPLRMEEDLAVKKQGRRDRSTE